MVHLMHHFVRFGGIFSTPCRQNLMLDRFYMSISQPQAKMYCHIFNITHEQETALLEPEMRDQSSQIWDGVLRIVF